MQLDDMKAAWQTLTQRLEAQTTLTLQLQRENRLDRVRRGLRPLAWGHLLQMLFGLVVAFCGAAFWSAHRDVAHLLIAGVLVQAYGIGMIWLGAAVQALLGRIDYASPVLDIQRQLLRLRAVYVRGSLALGLAWWLLWVPLLQVWLMAEFDVDLYALAPGMIGIGYASGLVGLALCYPLYRWLRSHPRWARRSVDSLAGRGLSAALAQLEQLTRFAQE